MLHSAASDLGLHYLPITLLGISRLQTFEKYLKLTYFRDESIEVLLISPEKHCLIEVLVFLTCWDYLSGELMLSSRRWRRSVCVGIHIRVSRMLKFSKVCIVF